MTTFPAFMHLVQTLMRLTWPFTKALILCRLGLKTLLVLLLAWLTLCPRIGRFPHIAQT